MRACQTSAIGETGFGPSADVFGSGGEGNEAQTGCSHVRSLSIEFVGAERFWSVSSGGDNEAKAVAL